MSLRKYFDRDMLEAWAVWWLSVGGLLLICGALWVVQSYFEAGAFKRVTGREVSTWDAMFLQLRVDDD